MTSIFDRTARTRLLHQALEQRVVVLDGAMGTMIQRQGLTEADFRGTRFVDHSIELQGNNDLLVLTQPTVIREIHDEYLAAGSDVIETNTFNGTSVAQADYGTEAYVREINREAARIAKEATTAWTEKTPDRPRFVAGAIGPTNRTLSISPDVNDPAYRAISLRFKNDPTAFDKAWANAWFKLIHRDMGPRRFYLGSEIPAQEFAWQEPLPTAPAPTLGTGDIRSLKERIAASGIDDAALIRTAWASAASYRKTDMRGGANGGRIRLAPQKDWAANDPADLANVLEALEGVQNGFNRTLSGNKKVSLADVIVIGVPFGGYYIGPSADGTRPGAFYAGTQNDEPWYQMRSLAYHEAIPGHHFQRSLQVEQNR